MNRLQARGAVTEKKGVRRAVEFTGIDTLNLTLGKVRFIDLARPARNREIILGVENYVVKNVKSEKDLYGVVLIVLLKNGAPFLGGIGGATQDVLKDPAGAVEKGAKGLYDLLPRPPKK